jgi:hypothetical protein
VVAQALAVREDPEAAGLGPAAVRADPEGVAEALAASVAVSALAQAVRVDPQEVAEALAASEAASEVAVRVAEQEALPGPVALRANG